MSVETSRKIITFGAQFAFPLLSHKLESDRMGKHQEWTKSKHIILASLAFLADAGVNSVALLLAITGDYKGEAEIIKLTHIVGADSIPESLTNLLNKAKDKFGKLLK